MASKRLSDPGSAKSRSFFEALSGSSSDVSFPDIKIVSFRGLPSLWISEQEIRALAVPFQFSLVGFFPSKQPSLESIRRFFFNLKLNGEVSVTLLDPSHVLIKLANDLDYCRVFCHRSYLVYNCYMKLTKWSPLFDVSVESPVIPIWVSFPQLRPHLFSPRILHGLGSIFGKPLKIDTAISAGSRPSVAHVLVELDITKSYPDKIWLDPKNLGYVQPISMDEFPSFCASCRCICHVVGNCRDKILSASSKAVNVMPGSHLEPSPIAPVLAADNLRDTIDPVVSDVAELERVVLDPNGCCVSLEGIPSVLPVSDDVSLGLETPSYVEAVKAAGLVLDNVVPGDVHSDDVPCAVVPFVSFGGGGDTPVLDKSPINHPVTAPAALVSDGISKAITIHIAVMSDDELRAQVARSVNHSILVQSDWLNLDESPSPGLDGDFDGQFNDDIYSFMVGKVVDQPFIIASGKKWKGKSKNCPLLVGLLATGWFILDGPVWLAGVVADPRLSPTLIRLLIVVLVLVVVDAIMVVLFGGLLECYLSAGLGWLLAETLLVFWFVSLIFGLALVFDCFLGA
ncbi:hypothetical protein M5K25_022977 [Dendrobium thyrsiflorum]|uniref:DUF4283 domain-containing protein n=1 Tax=Dendrobium thyrsiflorum TaxID=117978 RepID=A0ABD0U7M5_DENTH